MLVELPQVSLSDPNLDQNVKKLPVDHHRLLLFVLLIVIVAVLGLVQGLLIVPSVIKTVVFLIIAEIV